MADFQNTIDIVGDDVAARMIVDGTIKEYNDNVIAIIGNSAFQNCKGLTSVNMPNVTSVESVAFNGCSKLTSVNMPNVTSVGNYAFQNCSVLTSIDMPNVTSVRNYAFDGCSNLKTLVLRKDTVCTTNSTTVVSNTPFASGKAGGTLLVPSALIERYKTATNWSAILSQNANNRFIALEDYTVDGTITGEIDWDKLNGGTT